jgi:hypothetical protein
MPARADSADSGRAAGGDFDGGYGSGPYLHGVWLGYVTGHARQFRYPGALDDHYEKARPSR